MTEINNNLAANIAQKVENFISKNELNKPEHVQNPPPEAELKSSDGKDISVKEAKHGNNTNLSFIEKSGTAVIALGFSIPSSGETKQLLNIGFSLATKLGDRAVCGNKICIEGEPVTSILLNFAVMASRQGMQNGHTHEQRREAFASTLHTFEKMADDNTTIKSYSEPEKNFLWDTAGIKMAENEEGKVDYLYYESPESQPKKLSKQDVVDIYSHILNVVDDDQLFEMASSMGKSLEQQIGDANRKTAGEQTEETKKKTTTTSSATKINKDKEEKVKEIIPDLKEDTRVIKSNTSETDYINQVDDRKKEEAKYHNRKLNEINQERLHKNTEKAEKLTEESVNKIKEESDLKNK
jgi:hypothetical protein